MSPKQLSTIIIVVIVAVIALQSFASAKEHVVGDDKGWGKGVNYTAWAEGKEFRVGDTLLFNYPAGSHNVIKVDGQGFKACGVPTNADAFVSGSDVITLPSPGNKWYICGKPGHCESGQKLVITVHPGLQAPAASPSIAPTSHASDKIAARVCWGLMAVVTLAVMAI